MTRPSAFLASTWLSYELLTLRKKIHAYGSEVSFPIWVAEVEEPELNPQNGYLPIEIVDRCLEEVEKADRFYLIIDGSFGTLVDVEGRESPASFIELELFHAVMHEKTIYLIQIGEVDESTEIMKLVRSLSFGLKQRIMRVRSHEEAFDCFVNSLNRSSAFEQIRRLGDKSQLSGNLALKKHNDFANKRIFSEIQFMKGDPVTLSSSEGDLDLASELLTLANNEIHSNHKMSRTWLALRCLMHHHYNQSKDPVALGLWEKALKNWSSFAGWKGLHAHLWLGHIATLGSLYIVRGKQGLPPNKAGQSGHSDIIGGAFASVYYSLSKVSPKKMSTSFLSRSRLYLDYELSSAEETSKSGLYLIQGSVNLQERRLKDASDSYRNAINIIEEHKLGEARLGEALAELGWAETRRGKLLNGRSMIYEGVTLMRNGGADAGPLARGMRKLAAAQLLTLNLSGALDTATSASSLIETHGLQDQRDLTIRSADYYNAVLGKSTDK
ncbi:MAG: hypothetical protein DRR42_08925 [Gammaproteobacteria bacterium]|nr:MAG: hypothetical protein DRR42_08925 [Gammaproteobacteria bacterium]